MVAQNLIPQSNAALAARAARVMPGRQSNLRATAEPQVFIDRGLGQRLWDVEGRELIDLAIGMGPGIWGHGNREYLDAIHAQLEKVFVVASGMLQTALEVEVAERICHHVPCADQVRFVTTGSEALQMAIRLARAYTGRRYFVRFDGHYHGWLDNVFGGPMAPQGTDPPHALFDPGDPLAGEGRSPLATQESFKIGWNDAAALERLLAQYGDQIALVLMEGVMTNGGCCLPEPGYLQQARELCTRHGVLLCMDEVITGFRMGLGGAQAHFGVVPDLASFGKAIAGGMALAAVAGRRDILDLLRVNRVVGAGTFNAAPVSLAAALATLRMLERGNGAAHAAIDRSQGRLQRGMLDLARKYDHAFMIQGVRGVFCGHFSAAEKLPTPVEIVKHADIAKARRFRAALIEQGVYAGRGDRYFVSAALDDATIDEALRRIDKAFANLGTST